LKPTRATTADLAQVKSYLRV